MPGSPQEYHKKIITSAGKKGWCGGKDLPKSAEFTKEFSQALMQAWQLEFVERIRESISRPAWSSMMIYLINYDDLCSKWIQMGCCMLLECIKLHGMSFLEQVVFQIFPNSFVIIWYHLCSCFEIVLFFATFCCSLKQSMTCGHAISPCQFKKSTVPVSWACGHNDMAGHVIGTCQYKWDEQRSNPAVSLLHVGSPRSTTVLVSMPTGPDEPASARVASGGKWLRIGHHWPGLCVQGRVSMGFISPWFPLFIMADTYHRFSMAISDTK